MVKQRLSSRIKVKNREKIIIVALVITISLAALVAAANFSLSRHATPTFISSQSSSITSASINSTLRITSISRSFTSEPGPLVEIYPSPKDVIIVLNKQNFSSGDNLMLHIVNNSSDPVAFGESYVLQYLHNSTWIAARWLTPDIWIAIAYILKPGESHDQEVMLFPVLTGNYRLLKEVSMSGVSPSLGVRGTIIVTFQVVKGTPVDEIPKAHLSTSFWNEFHSFCANPAKGDRRQVIDTVMWFIGNYTTTAEKIQFLGYGTNYDVILIRVMHATMDFVQRWPDECQGVRIEITVVFWALTEPQALKD